MTLTSGWAIRLSRNRYLEKKFLPFTNVTNLKLTVKLAIVDNPGQVVMDFKEKTMKKKNKCTAKRKERLAKLFAPIRSFLSPYP